MEYLPIHLQYHKNQTIHVGKYTSPMDPMGSTRRYRPRSQTSTVTSLAQSMAPMELNLQRQPEECELRESW